tara:strand:+ start:497 stop:1204 length:708 start_codon:yes stop_codon:yes gene_type:complete
MKNKLSILFMLIYCINLKAQEKKTTFGLQYKPIIPAAYFNSSEIIKDSNGYGFNLNPKYSNSFGMILRQKINNTFSLESGLNYIQRNYQLKIIKNTINLEAETFFGIRSYEVPLQLLIYVRASKHWHLNVAFGISHNVLTSDIKSYAEENTYFFQNTYRKNGGYRALLANVGMEYRTNKKGYYYIGTSLHRPWREIARSYPEYNDGEHIFNNESDFFLEMLGSFITIDLRYFFAE